MVNDFSPGNVVTSRIIKKYFFSKGSFLTTLICDWVSFSIRYLLLIVESLFLCGKRFNCFYIILVLLLKKLNTVVKFSRLVMFFLEYLCCITSLNFESSRFW